MRVLDKIISFLFSVIILIVSILLILVGVGYLQPQMILDVLAERVLNKEIISTGFFNPVTITGIVLFILALKTTVFMSLFKVKSKAPISVKTKNGEVQIAQETIINTARNATLSFDNIKDVQAKMVKKGKGVVIYEIVQVYSNTNIRDLTSAVQEEVKEKITSTTGVLVNNVNIKIKNIYNGGKKKETSEPKVTEFVPVVPKPIEEKTDDVFNVDEAVKKAEEEAKVEAPIVENTASTEDEKNVQ